MARRHLSSATVDVAPILDKAVKAARRRGAGARSIVDLMKALDIDSSFAAQGAGEGTRLYPRQQRIPPRMNIWLHKQVMTKLAAPMAASCRWRSSTDASSVSQMASACGDVGLFLEWPGSAAMHTRERYPLCRKTL